MASPPLQIPEGNPSESSNSYSDSPIHQKSIQKRKFEDLEVDEDEFSDILSQISQDFEDTYPSTQVEHRYTPEPSGRLARAPHFSIGWHHVALTSSKRATVCSQGCATLFRSGVSSLRGLSPLSSRMLFNWFQACALLVARRWQYNDARCRIFGYIL